MVTMNPVVSSNVEAVGYEPESQTLHVTFKNGGHYTYAGVPQEVYNTSLDAESVGKWLNSEIKPHYPATKVQ